MLACPQPTLSSSCDSARTWHVVCLPPPPPPLPDLCMAQDLPAAQSGVRLLGQVSFVSSVQVTCNNPLWPYPVKNVFPFPWRGEGYPLLVHRPLPLSPFLAVCGLGYSIRLLFVWEYSCQATLVCCLLESTELTFGCSGLLRMLGLQESEGALVPGRASDQTCEYRSTPSWSRVGSCAACVGREGTLLSVVGGSTPCG